MFEFVEKTMNDMPPSLKPKNNIYAPVASSQAKRLFDIFLSFFALIFLAPVFILISIIVKLNSNGPIIFRQRRTGLNGKEFYIWKFRTMTVTEDSEVVIQAKVNDSRVTYFGKFLRRTSLDELPQIVNVLKGDMSLVGPRPHALSHDYSFSHLLDTYAERFNTRPGITGLAQINGHRGEIHSQYELEKRIKSDIYYIENWTFALDLIIILKTIPLLISDKNAY